MSLWHLLHTFANGIITTTVLYFVEETKMTIKTTATTDQKD